MQEILSIKTHIKLSKCPADELISIDKSGLDFKFISKNIKPINNTDIFLFHKFLNLKEN